MKRFQLTKNFYLDEFVDFELYIEYARRDKLYKLAYKIDRQLLFAVQKLRDEFGIPLTINNWWELFEKNNFDIGKTNSILKRDRDLRTNKYNQWSGLRRKGFPYYSPDSMHTEFKAVDIHFYGINIHKLPTFRKYVYENWYKLGITGMEVDVSWLHIDTRFIPQQIKLFIFNKFEVLNDWKPKAA